MTERAAVVDSEPRAYAGARLGRKQLPELRRGGGFTLIELLVVLGIITVLVALLVPALAGAKKLVKSASCKSNLRQLGLAVRAYVDEDSVYPPFVQWDHGEASYWPDRLAKSASQHGVSQFIPSSQPTVFACPSFRTDRPAGDMVPITYGYNDIGYAFHGLGAKFLAIAGGFMDVPVIEADVLVPSDTIAMGDGIARLMNGMLTEGRISLQRWIPSEPLGASLQRMRVWDKWVRSRHAGRANVLFCDGHVEANKLNLLFYDCSDRALRRWNRDHEPYADRLLN